MDRGKVNTNPVRHEIDYIESQLLRMVHIQIISKNTFSIFKIKVCL